MKHLVYITIVFLTSGIWLSSCRTKYVPLETKITETTIIHDTTFTEKLVPYKDSVSVRDTFSFLSNPYAYSWAVWDNGTLHHSLGIWSTAVLVIKVPHFVERIKTIDRPVPYKVEKKVEVEKKLSWWQSFLIWSGKIAWLIFIPWIIYKTNKRLGWISWLIKRIF